MNRKDVPNWQKNFVLFSESYPIIQLYSNIEDIVQFSSDGTDDVYMQLNEWINRTCHEVPNTLVVFYSVLNGFSNVYTTSDIDEFQRMGGSGNTENFMRAVEKVVRALRSTTSKRIVVVIDSSIRCLTATPVIPAEDQKAFTMLKAAFANNTSALNHQLVFISERSNDVPAFMLGTRSASKSIIIPQPDQVLRNNFLNQLYAHRNFPEKQLYSVAQKASDLTLKEIKTALSKLDHNRCTIRQIENTIKLFKMGVPEDPWSLISQDSIDNAEKILGEQVFGQEEAVAAAAQLIQSAASGFSNAFQEDGKTCPKGTLFLSGLTGTGKTELARAIARLVFGSADAIIKFDMGEFSQSHSAERLTGSPPGYVGHEAGGQLTEAIKERPFSLVLFDEIEKAHPSIFNKFLAILDEGRLTDGKGVTVSFENSIIVFTSNLGADKAANETDPAKVKKIIFNAIKNYCELPPDEGIGKPELYSRLAGNIVVFNPLNQDMLEKIYSKNLNQIKEVFASNYNITIETMDDFERQLRSSVDDEIDKGEYPGGRGVKKALEKYYKNPLLQFCSNERCIAGDVITITGFSVESRTIHLIGSVRHRLTRQTNNHVDSIGNGTARPTETNTTRPMGNRNPNNNTSSSSGSSGFKVVKKTPGK